MAQRKHVTRKGSGRTKGSFSFVVVTLGDLNAKFKESTQPVIVSRKWAETAGFSGLTAHAANKTVDSIQGLSAESAVEVKLTDVGE